VGRSLAQPPGRLAPQMPWSELEVYVSTQEWDSDMLKVSIGGLRDRLLQQVSAAILIGQTDEELRHALCLH
jgi:hypothetical protein